MSKETIDNVTTIKKPGGYRDAGVFVAEVRHFTGSDTAPQRVVLAIAGIPGAMVSIPARAARELGEALVANADVLLKNERSETLEIKRLKALVKLAYMEGRQCFWDPQEGKKTWQTSSCRASLNQTGEVE